MSEWLLPATRSDGPEGVPSTRIDWSALTQPLRLPQFPDIGAPCPSGRPPWHPPCNLSVLQRRALPEKGKPAVRWGRKATGQAMGLTAGLPKEERCKQTPGERRLPHPAKESLMHPRRPSRHRPFVPTILGRWPWARLGPVLANLCILGL